MYVNIKEGDMGGGDGPGKPDRIAIIQALNEKEKGIMARLPYYELPIKREKGYWSTQIKMETWLLRST